MPFVKTYWISLLSGVVALGAITLAVLGLRQDSVVTEMQNRVGEASEISTRRNNPKNQEIIDAEQERGRRFEQQYKKTLDEAARINERKPLLEGVFPSPPRLDLAYRFQTEYGNKFYEFPRHLLAGDVPSVLEIEDEREIMDELARRKQLQGEEPPTPGAQPTPYTPVAPPMAPSAGRGAPPGMQGRGAPPGVPTVGGGPGRMPGVNPAYSGTGGQMGEAERRAAVKKARNIRIYATAAQGRTVFHRNPNVFLDQAPSARDMWYAQVGLWVQEDVVNAIAKLNDEAARQLGGEEACVANMPVKRIVGIQVLGYVTSNGLFVPFASEDTAGFSPQAGPAPPAFTARNSDSRFDVIRFTLTVVVRQPDMLRLVDQITRENFYQLINIDYQVAPEVEGSYFYGGDPVVRATMDFEGYMARKVYEAMMPEAVLEELGIKQEGGE